MNDDPYFPIDVDSSSEIIKNQILSTWHLEEDNEYITTQQIRGLILEHCQRDQDEFLLNNLILEEIINQSLSILFGSCLSSMAARGEVECYWDDEANDMIWSLPEND